MRKKKRRAAELKKMEERRAKLERGIDFLEDDEADMTWGRRIALKLMNHSWYYPQQEETGKSEGFDEQEKPSLEKAWAYFEHVALERYMVNDDDPTKMERADPGEHKYKTRLYNPIMTPHVQVSFNKVLALSEHGYELTPASLICTILHL